MSSIFGLPGVGFEGRRDGEVGRAEKLGGHFRVQAVPTVVVLSADYPFRRGGGAG